LAAPIHQSAKQNGVYPRLQAALPIHLIAATLAVRAGELDSENQARGVRLPLADLLIGVTALELGYSVATASVRHFQMNPTPQSRSSECAATRKEKILLLRKIELRKNPNRDRGVRKTLDLFTPVASSYRLSSIGQQCQPLFAIHVLPRDKLLGKHIHPTKKSQLDEKL
jgi:hypothetical protein